MQVYLVGGAVRDQLLGLPVKERDWVVVGATPADMLAQGFKQVGRDFPVFLHPETHEEYALARQERKTGVGYHGFTCRADPTVTLQEDLSRRDLTINAMAMDAAGHLIDPYQGQKDLAERQLRHVSGAFVEDPVRVLRLARFQARFYALGFRVAAETRLLAYQMVMQGELAHLVPERVWQEWEASLSTLHPAQFIMCLRQTGALQVILPELDALFGVPAGPRHHPEIDSGVHVLQVLQYLRNRQTEVTDPVTLFASLMHDLGKAQTPLAQWPSHAGHDKRGEGVIVALCERLKIPRVYRELAVLACRYHLQIYDEARLSAAARLQVLMDCGVFRHSAVFERVLAVCEADVCAGSQQRFPQGDRWRRYAAACLSVDANVFVKQGLSGDAIKTAMHQARVAAIQQVCEEAE